MRAFDIQCQHGRSRSRGFSLLDLLVAFTVFSVALLVALTIFPSSMQSVRKSHYYLMASHLGQAQMEETIDLPFSNINVGTTSNTTTLVSTVNGSQASIAFTSTLTVTSVSVNLKDVLCVTSWQETVGGPTHSLTLETLVANGCR